MGGNMDFFTVLFDFLFKVILLSVVGGIALFGLSIFGITKGIKALSEHFNKKKMLKNGPQQHAFQDQSESRQPPRPDQMPRDPNPQPRPQPQPQPQPQPKERPHAYGQPQRPAYVRFDVERGVNEAQLRSVMHDYEGARVVGAYARDVLQTLDARTFRMRSLLPEIDAKFEPRSISWEKFHTSAEAALDAIFKNCTLLANRIQSFDVAEYCNYELFQEQGGFSTNPNPGEDRLARWRLVFDMRQEMDSLRDANEHLLTELGKLASELSHLDSDKIEEDNSDIMEDISRLVNETKYYR